MEADIYMSMFLQLNKYSLNTASFYFEEEACLIDISFFVGLCEGFIYFKKLYFFNSTLE